MWTYSKKMKSVMRKYGLQPSQKAIADLVAAGWEEADAYQLFGLYNPVYADEFNEQEMRKMLDDVNMKRYIAFAKSEIKTNVEKLKLQELVLEEKGSSERERPEKKFRDKDEVIDELASTVGDLKGKDKADVLMKIADLQQMKKEKDEGREKTVHFYLPLKCDYCALYKKYRQIKKDADSR